MSGVCAVEIYCRACSAAPGTPCSNPWSGGDVRPHATRILDALRAALTTEADQ